MVDSASDIFSIASFVSVTMATSVWAFRRVWLNSANFEQSPKAFVRRIFRWGVQLGLDCWVGRGWEGRGCLEGALDLLTGVDVMARGRAPRGALRVFCEEILFITLVGDLRTKYFSRKCGDFFAQIIIHHMLITDNKKLCGVFG